MAAQRVGNWRVLLAFALFFPGRYSSRRFFSLSSRVVPDLVPSGRCHNLHRHYLRSYTYQTSE